MIKLRSFLLMLLVMFFCVSLYPDVAYCKPTKEKKEKKEKTDKSNKGKKNKDISTSPINKQLSRTLALGTTSLEPEANQPKNDELAILQDLLDTLSQTRIANAQDKTKSQNALNRQKKISKPAVSGTVSEYPAF